MAETTAVEIINAALAEVNEDSVVSKLKLVDVFLDVRLATDDPAVVSAVDEVLASFDTPTLVDGDHARQELARVHEIASMTPANAPV